MSKILWNSILLEVITKKCISFNGQKVVKRVRKVSAISLSEVGSNYNARKVLMNCKLLVDKHEKNI